MIVQNSKQLIDVIKSEMKTSPDGFELGIIELSVVHLNLESIIEILIEFVVFDPRWKPLDMLMNVSMNVVTYFCMGENFLLKDKEFIHIADMVKERMSHHFIPQRHLVTKTGWQEITSSL